MKQKERHRLKQDKFVQGVASARDFIEPRQRQLAMLGIAVVVALLAVAGVMAMRQQASSGREAALAEALVVLNSPVQPPTPALPATGDRPATPELQAPGTYPTDEARLLEALPKLEAAVNAASDSTEARFHLATTLARLNRHEEAIEQYELIVSADGDSLYGQMAQLGLANEQTRLGDYAPAIATYQALLDDESGNLPLDALLMRLAEAYDASGNSEEASKTFSRVVHEYPTSPYSVAAGRHLP